MLRIDDKLTRAETEDYVDRANKSMDEALAAGANPGKWLRGAFENADMTLGVWPDSSARYQVGIAVLKGKAVLARVRDTKQGLAVGTTYVRCTSAAEAQAMYDVHGDDQKAAA